MFNAALVLGRSKPHQALLSKQIGPLCSRSLDPRGASNAPTVRTAGSGCGKTGHATPVAARIVRRLAVCTLALHIGFAFAESTHTLALFPAASDTERQGFARVVNHGVDPGEVPIVAVDDTGRRADSITLTLEGRQTAHFNSDDLENGNERKGLSGAVGSGQGDWRLELTSELDIEVLGYIRTADGFLTAMHDTVPVTGNRHRVAMFNPASNANQASALRIVNLGSGPAHVSVSGVDDSGNSRGEVVRLSVPSDSALVLSATQRETGDSGLRGTVGDGRGKWRLMVDSEQPLHVMNLLASPTGHLTNLSTGSNP